MKKHLRLFEFTDLSWYPQVFRCMQTDYLQFAAAQGSAHQYLFPLLRKAMQQAGTTHIVDLCSGGAGPWLGLLGQFRQAGLPITVTLTDRYPNPAAIQKWPASTQSEIVYLPEPVDAACVPETLNGMRTLFEGFHHFAPQQAAQILQDAYERRAAIGIFEIQYKAPFRIVLLLLSPLLTLLSYLFLTPLITPRTWSRFLWTYLVPVVPLATCWDGIVSLLRVYSPHELDDLTRPLQSPAYTWESGRAPTGTPIFEYIYLLGYPAPRIEHQTQPAKK